MADRDGDSELQLRVALEELLDLHRGDVRAAGLDQVREPPGPVEPPFGVDRSAVLGAEEAVGIEDELLRHLVVARHQRRALHGDLPLDTGR